tara:strand:- start:297 stop:593 length:297 start_codon:yes stop_codon:yes gene_type:complete
MIYNYNCKYINLIYIPTGFLLGDFLYSLYIQKSSRGKILKTDTNDSQNKKNVTFNTELVNRNFEEGAINIGSIIGSIFGFVVYFSKHEIMQKLYKKYF